MLGAWQAYAVNSNPPYAITANAAYRRQRSRRDRPLRPAHAPRPGRRARPPLQRAQPTPPRLRPRRRRPPPPPLRPSAASSASSSAGPTAPAWSPPSTTRIDGRPSPPPRLVDVRDSAEGVRWLLALRVRSRPAHPLPPRLPRGRLVRPHAPGRLVRRCARRHVARRPPLPPARPRRASSAAARLPEPPRPMTSQRRS